MFSKSSRKKEESLTNLPIDTVIATGITIKGDIVGTGAIRIDGVVEGNVELDKGVILGEKAEIIGTVKSKETIIYGKLTGDLECSCMYLKSTGHVEGNIVVNTFSVDMGGKYNGNLKMTSNEVDLHRKLDSKKAVEN